MFSWFEKLLKRKRRYIPTKERPPTLRVHSPTKAKNLSLKSLEDDL